jgi:hypothetical protein
MGLVSKIMIFMAMPGGYVGEVDLNRTKKRLAKEAGNEHSAPTNTHEALHCEKDG